MLIHNAVIGKRRLTSKAKSKMYTRRFPELNKHNFKYHYAHDMTRVGLMIQEIRDKYPIIRKM